VLLEVYTGMADAHTGMTNGPASRFQVSSISKQFVAACALLLADNGSLSIDDSVAAWFPGSPKSWNAITLADLMAHTAGLGHWPDYPGIDPARPITDDDFVAALWNRPLPDALPAPHSYSSPGYGLLARAVERAGGTAYARFVTDNIFGPLGLRESFVGNGYGKSDLARGYRGGAEVSSWDLDTASKGAGDVWTTARDLDRWDRAVVGDDLLSPGARESTFRTRTPTEGLPTVHGYGLGWVIGELHGQPVYEHPGDNPGYLGFNAILPTVDARLVLLSNDETTDIFTPAIDLLEELSR
jgi:CubicO group peptidase (beta-lactamase class C family)